LFYNYAKSPLFSIRSKTVYKDNYQFYFFPKNQNIKDNQDDNIDEIKFCEEHPDIIQFFKDFINNKYEEIFNKIKIAYNNICKNISNDIDITDYGFYYDEKKDENGNYRQYIIQDNSGDVF